MDKNLRIPTFRTKPHHYAMGTTGLLLSRSIVTLPCTGPNFTSSEYPPGFNPSAIVEYLNVTEECFWFDDALTSEQSDGPAVWYTRMPRIWRNIVPDDVYNVSLVNCYDYAVARASRPAVPENQTVSEPSDYVKLGDQCCRKSSFAAGDQDLGGVGVSMHILDTLALSNRVAGMQMLTALAFEAFLAGLILIEGIGGDPEGPQKSRLPSAVRGIVEAFLDIGIFFSLSVFIAAAVALSHFGETGYYDPTLLSNIFNFTVGPMLVVVSLHFRQLRRRKLRVGIVVILVFLAHALLWVARRTSLKAKSLWVDTCCPPASALVGSTPGTILRVNLFLTALMVHQFVTPAVFRHPYLLFRPRLWKEEKERWDSPPEKDSSFLLGLYYLIVPRFPPFRRRLAGYSFFFTCLQLLFIYSQRFKLESCAKGGVYKENQFGFGQTLAALMWLPVLADFGSILCCKS